jgi:hypothetical protein
MQATAPLYYLAVESGYGCQGYGTSSYDSACSATAGSATTNSASKSGLLQNTGAGALLPLVVSITLIAAALLIFFKRARN